MVSGPWKNSQAYWFNHLFEKNWQLIAEEALSLYSANLFYDHKQSEEHTDTSMQKLANKWKMLSVKNHPHLAPITWGIVKLIPEIVNCKKGLYYFSLIPAGGIIKPHVSALDIDVRHRHQLCLQLPPTASTDEVYFQIGGEKRCWELGKVMTFDDAYLHDAKNLSSGDRLVFLYDSDSI